MSVGATTDCGSGLLVDLEVGASTGIGSTLREVTEFRIARQGYSFRRGDVIKPVGLVTDKSLSAPLSEFELTVLMFIQIISVPGKLEILTILIQSKTSKMELEEDSHSSIIMNCLVLKQNRDLQ